MKKLIKGTQRKFGPLVPLAEGFRNYLRGLGYSIDSASNLVRVFHHLSRWMSFQGKEISELNPEEIELFLSHRRKLGYICWRSQKGVAPIIRFLVKIEALQEFKSPRSQNPIAKLMDAYRKYLNEERCLQKSTVRSCCDTAQSFLTITLGTKLAFKKLNAEKVRSFVLNESRCFGRPKAKALVSPLRSLLRWLYIQGKTESCLSRAVPAIAGRRSSLPQGISDQKVQSLIKSCDRRTHRGRRSYALLLLMSYMGLRKGEIAQLTLDCIDWKQGEIKVRSKGSEGRLPLSEEAGKALINYIQKSRRQEKQRNIFLRLRAPHIALSSSGISNDLLSVCKDAGVSPISPHKLRHTVAMRMLERGSSLSEIGQVLRHARIETTAIYAKVDSHSLQEVVCAWPGGGR